MGRALAFVFLGIVLSGFGLLMLQGNENFWMCSNGMWIKHGKPASPEPTRPCSTKGVPMNVTSPSFAANAEIPTKYSCQGEGIVPTLTFSGIPAATMSLAITLEDPDAPGGTFHHWLVWNINPKTKEVTDGDLPDGSVVGTNSSGKADYIPPCPPDGSHRYVFTVYALDTSLPLTGESDRTALDAAMQEHILSQGTITGRYTRR